jgi:hypothetical protein
MITNNTHIEDINVEDHAVEREGQAHGQDQVDVDLEIKG